MRRAGTVFLSAILAVAMASTGLAQKRKVNPDETVNFSVSAVAVTRIAVKGDRIRRLINDQTAFEMTNDEETGDVFLRPVDKPTEPERGFLVTENGVTLGYVFKVVNKPVDAVLIEIAGKATPEDESAALTNGDVGATGSFTDDVASWATDAIRSVVADHVAGRTPKGRDRSVVARARGKGWRAKVLIAAAGKEARLVTEREFSAPRVRAVYVVRHALAAGEKTFVIILEDSK